MWRGFAILCQVLTETVDRPVGQILALCDGMERLCRPRSGDAHLVRWTCLRVAARRGDFVTADEQLRRILVIWYQLDYDEEWTFAKLQAELT